MAQSHNFKIIRLNEVDSTNLWAKKAFGEKIVASGSVIVTATQRAGRGQMQTKWHDEKGKNLLLTVIIDFQNFRASEYFRLNEVVSLALIDVLKQKVPALIKWPNDILVGDKKIAGILIETILQGNYIKTAFVGVGLNVNQMLFPKEINAASLALLSGVEWDLEMLLDDFLVSLENRIGQLQTPNVLARQYYADLLGTQEYLKYQDSEGIFYAQVHKIEDDGRLVLQVKGETVLQYYSFKEVQLIRD